MAERLTGFDCCFTRCMEPGADKQEIREDCSLYKVCLERQIFEKLQHYEDLDEQGRLITLPCAVGDTVYLFSYDTIHPFTVNGFEINEYEVEFKGSYCGEEKNLEHWAIRLPVSRIGKTVFLTKEEAEVVLKEVDE